MACLRIPVFYSSDLFACGTVTGELTADEAAVKEEEHSSLANKFWSMFGGGAAEENDEEGGETSATQGDADKIIEHALKWEDMAIVQRDDHRAYPSCTKRLVVVLNHKEGFANLQLLQLRYVASLMKRDSFVAGARVLEAGDEPLMVWCAWGRFKVLQAVSSRGSHGIFPSGRLGGDRASSRGHSVPVVRTALPRVGSSWR